MLLAVYVCVCVCERAMVFLLNTRLYGRGRTRNKVEWPVEKIAIGIWRAEEPRYEYSVVMRAPPGEPCVPGKGEGKMIGTTRYRCRLRPRLVALRCICEREMHRHI